MAAMIGGQMVPERLPGMTGREAQADVIAPLVDAPADLEQAQPQGVQLQARDVLVAQPAAHGIEQPVRGRVQQQAELVGPETVATQAIGEAGHFQILDGVLAIAALDVPIVERLGRIIPRGDHEAGVRSLGQRLGFDDHPPGMVLLGLIGHLAKEADFLRAGCGPLALRFGGEGAASAVRRGLVVRPMV